MSNYKAFIAKIDKVIEIPGANNVHVAKVLGESVIVAKSWQEGFVGVFFPAGTQLSLTYCENNNLHRDAQLNLDKEKTGFFDANRKVRAQPFLKVKSEGFFAALDSLAYTGSDISLLKVGDTFEELNGVKIAEKFINPKTQRAIGNANQKKVKKVTVPHFFEHVETAQFKQAIHNIEEGDLVSIQTKKHGTSGRYSYTKVLIELPKWKQLINKVLPVFPEYKWDYVAGTRRTVLMTPEKAGFHGSEAFRFQVLEALKPYMVKGMTIYCEIVGFANGKPIMQPQSTTGLKDKKVSKKYGDTVIYKYGCLEGTHDFHIYRITFTTESGETIDFTQAQLVEWCQARGIKPSHDLVKPFIYDGDSEKLLALVEQLTEREDVLTEDYHDPSHISEGVIIRVDRKTLTPLFLKSKSFRFKVLEGIAQEKEENVDLEDIS